MSKKPRDRQIYRGKLSQKKEVWLLWVEGNTAKEITARIQASGSTIYKWIGEFEDISAEDLLAIFYEKDGPPDLIINKWKSYHIGYPEMIREIDELITKKRTKSNQPASSKESENVIAPPNCFEKDERGLCRNAGLRSDCGPCFYLRLGRTQENVDRLIEQSLGLQSRVEMAKEDFLRRFKGVDRKK